MSVRRRWENVCDGCGATVLDPDMVEQEGDVLRPDGWTNTIMDEDFCGFCIASGAHLASALAV